MTEEDILAKIESLTNSISECKKKIEEAENKYLLNKDNPLATMDLEMKNQFVSRQHLLIRENLMEIGRLAAMFNAQEAKAELRR